MTKSCDALSWVLSMWPVELPTYHIYNLRPTTYDLLPTTHCYGGEHMLSQLFVIVCVPATSFNDKKL